MADKTIPQLDPVVTVAPTDRFGVRQAGDTEDKRETRAQVHSLVSGEHFILAQVDEVATPTLAFGDGDSGFFEDADDSISKSIAGQVQAVTGPDGKLFINTLTGAVSFTGGNIITPTPDKMSIFGARTATDAIDGGAVEIWGGYAGGGGGEATGGNIEMFGGEADILPGDIILTGGVATVQGNGGIVRIAGGAAFGTNATGGRADVLGGLGIGTGNGGQVNVTAGNSGSGVTGVGGTLFLSSGDAASTDGVGGQVNLDSGLGRGTDAGGLIDIQAGDGGVGGANSGDGGSIQLIGGGNSGGSGTGGAVSVTGGAVTGTGIGGAASLEGGAGAFNSDGGIASVTGGASGSNTGGDGGAVTLTGGAALGTNGDGGDINLIGGVGAGSGVAGDINFTGDLLASTALGPAIRDVATGEGAVTIAPNQADTDTGLGHVSDDIMSIIIGGTEAISWAEASAGVLVSPKRQNITAFAGGGQGSATVIQDSYITIGTVATAGDSVVLPAVFRSSTLMFIKNNGANAADVFPASGDDLGQGVDTAVSVAAGESVSFLGQTENALWTPWIVDNVPSELIATNADGPQIFDFAASFVTPTLVPRRSDGNSGIGSFGLDALSLIAGGNEAIRFTEASSQTIQAHSIDTTVTANPGGGQGSATVLLSSYNIVNVVGTSNDSVRMPSTFKVGTIIQMINTAATRAEVFPASGDDLGAGVDTAVTLAEGASLAFIATVADSTWEQYLGGSVAQSLLATTVDGPAIPDQSATATVPTLIPDQSDLNTGIGGLSDRLDIIVGGVQGLRVDEGDENTGDILIAYPTQDSAITAFATGGQASATQLGMTISIITTCATAGDSVKLMRPSVLGAWVYVRNDGAASLDVFPFAGDDLGQGTDVAVACAPGQTRSFISTTTSGNIWVEMIGTVADSLVGASANGPEILDINATTLVPNIRTDKSDVNTGIGNDGADSLAFICGGDPSMELVRASNETLVSHTVEGFITANAGGGQGSAFPLDSSYSNVTTVGTAGDSVRLPAVFNRGTIIVVANSAAANAMDVFPASGDDLGAGTDTAISVAVGGAAMFFATVANANWQQIKG